VFDAARAVVRGGDLRCALAYVRRRVRACVRRRVRTRMRGWARV
jgi:hypothetical protein